MRGFVFAIFVILPQVYAVNIDSDTIIKSCCDVAVKRGSYFTASRQSGVYNIIDFCVQGPLIKGYCDVVTDGGGWIVVLRRRQYANVDFDRFWSDYESGFGNIYSEFWYGLRSLHCLTSRGTWELRIDFTFANETKSYLHYNKFKVGPASDNYRLRISGFTGITPTDPFATAPLNGQQFSTRDRDNDGWRGGHCAVRLPNPVRNNTALGGWWYKSCFQINLNYNRVPPYGFMYLARKWYTPTFVEMKIHPTYNCGR